jgi:hypothetical protein
MTTLIQRASAFVGGSVDPGRRDFLTKFTLGVTALLVAPLDFILRPTTAYAAVCGPAPGCNDGYTAFCCSIHRGINNCPPGHFIGGWWKANNSSECLVNGQPSARYYMDCHPRCSCPCGSNGFCSSSCWSCSCHCPDTGTCDERHVCCAVFRYGQCNTDIGCSGPVTCRVVSCVAPYQLFDSCSTTLRTDNYTANQTAPCLAGQP